MGVLTKLFVHSVQTSLEQKKKVYLKKSFRVFNFSVHNTTSPIKMNAIACVAMTVLVSVISASEHNPYLGDQDIKMFHNLVGEIRKHIEAAPLNDIDTTCNNICSLLETDSHVHGKKLRDFKPFCDNKCPDLIVEAQSLNAEENKPL